MSIVREFWDFMKVRKKWWLLPIVVVLLVVWYAGRVRTGLGAGTLHLHHLLSGECACCLWAGHRRCPARRSDTQLSWTA